MDYKITVHFKVLNFHIKINKTKDIVIYDLISEDNNTLKFMYNYVFSIKYFFFDFINNKINTTYYRNKAVLTIYRESYKIIANTLFMKIKAYNIIQRLYHKILSKYYNMIYNYPPNKYKYNIKKINLARNYKNTLYIHNVPLYAFIYP